MSVYLDASVIVALFSDDAFTSRAEAIFGLEEPVILVSDLAAAEFASSIARRVRIKEVTRHNARAAFASFDEWMAHTANPVILEHSDIEAANAFLRRLDLPLRTMDAAHIAIARRLTASLATFDVKMADCARTLGLSVLNL